jgi:hypothetical protein
MAQVGLVDSGKGHGFLLGLEGILLQGEGEVKGMGLGWIFEYHRGVDPHVRNISRVGCQAFYYLTFNFVATKSLLW